LLAPHLVAVLGCVGGEPASAAMAIHTHGIAGAYWVGTAPAARGKGLAELCTRTVGNAAFDRGATAVVLQASTMGEPIYKRMGYEAVTQYPYYVAFSTPEP
jgi:predicted GNAT family acetyltransferase